MFDGLIKTKSSKLVFTVIKVELVATVKSFCLFKDFIEGVLGDLFFFGWL